MDLSKVVTIAAPERLDSASVDEFKTETQAALASAKAMVIDFSRTRFVDSVGLGALVSLLKNCSLPQRDVRLSLAALSPQVRQIFELTRLYRLFDIFDTKEQAYADLAGAS
jgi:anti-sigma B factor antagonist